MDAANPEKVDGFEAAPGMADRGVRCWNSRFMSGSLIDGTAAATAAPAPPLLDRVIAPPEGDLGKKLGDERFRTMRVDARLLTVPLGHVLPGRGMTIAWAAHPGTAMSDSYETLGSFLCSDLGDSACSRLSSVSGGADAESPRNDAICSFNLARRMLAQRCSRRNW
jgi:hypothetical protein